MRLPDNSVTDTSHRFNLLHGAAEYTGFDEAILRLRCHMKLSEHLDTLFHCNSLFDTLDVARHLCILFVWFCFLVKIDIP
jgi:hypothetical protein